MLAGDLLIFDAFAPHRSGPNLSEASVPRCSSPSCKPITADSVACAPVQDSRRAFYLTFNRASEGDWRESYFADKAVGFPPDVDRLAGRDYAYKV